MKAIIVDDSRTIRMLIAKFLLAEGFTTLLEAGDGRDALEKLALAGPVDLAVVDWNMPVMDGLDFVTTLRMSKQHDPTRVVMLTTEAETTKVARAMDAGANAYMVKPFNAEVLRAKLDTIGLGKPGA